MVRPRLVEEGVPVGTGDGHDSDHSMSEEDAAVQRPRQPDAVVADTSSSLRRALGDHRKPAPTAKRRSHRTVIGGASEPHGYAYHQHHHSHGHHPPAYLHGHAQHVEIGPPAFDAPSAAVWQPMSHAQPHAHVQHMEIGPPVSINPTALPPPLAPHWEMGVPQPLSPPIVAPVVAFGQPPQPQQSSHRYASTPLAHRTHIEIGVDDRPTERMHGVEDQSLKAPLVVVDGANVAYSYSETLHGSLQTAAAKQDPDARGMRVAVDYFRAAGLRVLVVLPVSWFRRRPRPGASVVHVVEDDQLAVIAELQQQGLLVAAPPTDDDDAYALTIARREHVRSQSRIAQGGYGAPGYILSNDLFRDAQARDASGQLQEWLQIGGRLADGTEAGPGRISYAFCDTGRIDSHGERELEMVPNPRHPLVVWMEQQLPHIAR